MKKDYYKILNLTDEDRRLNSDEFQNLVKRNFRRLSMQFHPDRHANDPENVRKEYEEKFKEVAEAYAVLSDPEKKARYDQFGTVDGNPMDGFNGFEGFGDIADILRKMHGMGGFGGGFNPFGNMNMGGNTNTRSNIRLRCNITMQEAFNAGSKKIRYNRNKPCSHCGGSGSSDGSKSVDICPHCGGTGVIRNRQQIGFAISETISPCPYCGGKGKTLKNPCRHCNGTGLETVSETFEVKIPKGVFDGASVKYDEMGNYPENGNGQIGDLIIQFRIVASDGYECVNTGKYDLAKKLDVSVIDCILGDEVTFNGIDGNKVKVQLPQGIQSGEYVTVRGQGLKSEYGNRGDLIVVVNMVMPNNLSHDEKKELKKLKESKNFRV